MNHKMLRCRACSGYTLAQECPNCGSRTAAPHPPRFSPQDRYGKYRRRLKELTREEREK